MTNTAFEIFYDKIKDMEFARSERDLAKLAFKAVMESLVEAVEKEGKVTVRGYGTFYLRENKPRKIKSPLTKGKLVRTKKSYSLRFKPSVAVKKRLSEALQASRNIRRRKK